MNTLFVVSMLLSVCPVMYADDQNKDQAVQVDVIDDFFIAQDMNDQDDYDKFDMLADDMIRHHVPEEQPKEVSEFQYWIRRLGCPLLDKYLAAKIYLKNWLSRSKK